MSNENFNDEIGIKFIGLVDGQYVLELELEKRHRNMMGTVHGGVLCTMLDAAMARAYFTTLPEEKVGGATLEMKVNFLRPAEAGKLTAYGILVNSTQRTAFVEGLVKNQDGKLIAKASGTMILSAEVEGFSD